MGAKQGRSDRCGGGLLATAILAAAGTLLLDGCKVGPDYRPPEMMAPDAWHIETAKGLQPGPTDLRAWWTVFHDPLLDRLIDRAVRSNRDLATAFARVEEARALRGMAASGYYPSVAGVGSSTFYRNSVYTPSGAATGGSHDQVHTLGLDAAWELDLFGGIRRGVEAAEADLQASVEDYRDLLVILLSEIASAYVDTRTIQERLHFAEENVASQRESVRLAQARFDTELASELDPHQARLNLANTESLIPTLQASLVQSIDRLAVLLGEYPAGLRDELSAPGAVPAVPAMVAVSPPTDLLRQRPDIRRAERRIAAETARVGVATADLYPRFFLGGTLALQASDLGRLFDASSSHTYSLGPSFRWNLFAGGRVRNQIRAEDARLRQALFQYEGTVLAAVGEVEDALVAYAREGERQQFLGRSVEEARRAVELVGVSYQAGLTDFQNVLDMQRTLFQQQDSLAQSHGQVAQDLIRIYRALGGGWSAPEERREGTPSAPLSAAPGVAAVAAKEEER